MNGRARITAAALLTLALPPLTAQTEPGGAMTNARRRWEWFYQQRAYPFNVVPVGAMARARQQKTSFFQSMLRAGNSAPPPIAGTTWQALGPTLIGVRDIGRTSTIAIHPTDANIMYVGGAQGGVWKTTDGGSSWVPLTDKQCSLAMGSIAIDPVNPQIVYAATGEQHFSGDSYYGCGVLRTTDGGATWIAVGATQFTAGAHSSRISRIVIVPSTAGTVASTVLFASSDNGLWKSTNGGTSWSQVRQGYHTDVAIADASGATVYAAAHQVGVFRSDNGGTTWSTLGIGFPTDSVGRIHISLFKTQANTLVASVANSISSGLRGIYKTTDGGSNWTKLAATGATCSPQCWYDQFIAVHPTAPDTIYFGGVSIYKSISGGASFFSITNNIHVDQHFLAFDPQDPSRIFATNDGGVFRSTNGGSTWTTLNGGLGLTQFYPGISLHPTDPLTVMGGTQDNGTLVTNGTSAWTAAFGGDGGWTAIDYENPNIRYLETQSPGGPRRSDNGGLSFVSKNIGINLTEGALFIPPLVMDPTDPKVLYYGTIKVYRTADRAESWQAISPNVSGAVSVIAPAPSNPNTVYVGTSTGQLQVTTNLSTWTVMASGLPLRSLTDIAVDRSDANTAYTTFSGFGTGHVFRTVNGGTTWTNVSATLPDMPVNAVAVDPASRGTVIVGTDLGVYFSSDSGSTWTVLDDGMPNVAVFDIAYNANTGALIAATHGRGMFKLQLNRPLQLVATPLSRRVSTVEGSTTPVDDSASVILSGINAGTAGWTATHTAAATWTTITTAAGTGSGKMRWSRNPTGLTSGSKVDTITITVAGAADSPMRIVDTLFVCSATPTVSLEFARRGVSAPAGLAATAPDSALVSFECGSGTTAWTAAPKVGKGITMITASGNGAGRVRWQRKTDSLLAGVYYDTILVTAPGATGSPVKLADSIIVSLAAQLGIFVRNDTVISGTPAPKNASTSLTILGDPGSAAWTVTHKAGATWNTITSTSGAGNSTLAWTKSGGSLPTGTYFDTITVAVAGAAPYKLPDILVVTAPTILQSCAVDHFFGVACLDAVQQKYLDLTGNNDGVFNLGDFLSYLARTPAPPGPPAIRGAKP